MTAAPRHRRRGLAIPFLIVGVLLAAWTGWWFYLAQQIEARLEARVEALRGEGWTITHGPLSTTGWPFRARVAVPFVDATAPSGHGLAAPEIVAEANAYRPDRWVVVAPEGLTVNRAGKGKVSITGEAIRMSVSGLTARFPDFRAELIRPVFTPHTGAEPFPIATAERVQFETRPHAPEGAAAAVAATHDLDVLFVLTKARGRVGGPVAAAAQQGELTLAMETTIQQADHLSGQSPAGVFADWTRAGGRFLNTRGRLILGESRAEISSDQLSASADGRLQGVVAVEAENPMAAIAGLAGTTGLPMNPAAVGATPVGPDGAARPLMMSVRFEGGRAWLGPLSVAPAPKLF